MIAATITEVLAIPGLPWIVTASVLAGLVRGFSGFGTAMVYLPIAGQFLAPFEALTTLVLMDLIGPLPNVPRAIRDGAPRDVLRLGVGLVLGLPLGLWVLTVVAPQVFRYGVSAVALTLLVLLMFKVRYRGAISPPMVYGAGFLGGFLGGAAGMAGPPVILLYMASTLPSQAIRGTTLLYLLLGDFLTVGLLWGSDHLAPAAFGLGIALMLPYTLANMVGAAIFHPGHERSYRAVAYVLIGVSALMGLPLFD